MGDVVVMGEGLIKLERSSKVFRGLSYVSWDISNRRMLVLRKVGVEFSADSVVRSKVLEWE